MHSSNNRRILLIEDDADIAELIRFHLEDISEVFEHASDGMHGASLALQQPWDMMLLDLNLPGRDGNDICREVRHAKPLLPIIILSARFTESERVVGLDSGADDYITKPFSTVEFSARVRAQFRRSDASQARKQSLATVSVGDITMDTHAREVRVENRPMALTVKEFDLLFVFLSSPNIVLSKSELLQSVWGHSYEGYLHTVNTHINRLRLKIEPDPKHPRYIKTVWGIGYKLCV